MATIRNNFYSSSGENVAQLPTENQQLAIPIDAVSQYSKNFVNPQTKIVGSFMFSSTSNIPAKVHTSFASELVVPKHSSSVEFPLCPFPSLAHNTSLEKQCLGEILPNFSFQNSTLMTQACNINNYPQNTHLDSNIGYVSHGNNLSNPTCGKSVLNIPINLLRSKYHYRCKLCSMQFQNPQAFGGHMSHHSKVSKAKDRAARLKQLGPTNSKKPLMVLQSGSSERGLNLKMGAPVELKNITVAKEKTEFEVGIKYKIMKEDIQKEQAYECFEDPLMKNDSTEATAVQTLPDEQTKTLRHVILHPSPIFQ